MGDYQLTCKNDYLGAIINRLIGEQNTGGERLEGKTEQVLGEDLLGTYALDIIYSGLAIDQEMDFTYNSIKKLPLVVASVYRRNKEDAHDSISATVKALSAFFFALAMNEHDCLWEVRRMPVLLNSEKPPKDPLWGVFRVQTGKNKKTDFLLPVSRGCHTREFMGKSILTFNFDLLIREYKAALGIDLEKRGLLNIVFDL